MKNSNGILTSAGPVGAESKPAHLPFYQKVLNMTLGIHHGFNGGGSNSPSTRKAEEPLASSPFRRGYQRPRVMTPVMTPVASAVSNGPSTPVVVVATTPPNSSSSSAAKAASIFRSFRRRSLRRSFRRTKSFLVKNPSTPVVSAPVTGRIKK